MKIDFDYKWYLATCKENGLNQNNDLAQYHLKKAKKQSKRMKYFMDALERYKDDEAATTTIENQIKKHNDRRITSMLDALESAEEKDTKVGEVNE